MIKKLPPGPKPPEEIFVVIEIPKGSQNKYELDKKLGLIVLDRVLHSPLHYPADYGHIPSTLCEDGDPLDALVLVTEPTFPGCLIKVRPVGMIEMEDEKGADDKILGVPVEDPRFSHVFDIKDVPEHFLKEISHFFEMYKALEPNKWVRVKGWFGAERAKKVIEEAVKLYRTKKL
jgi:inorganic pyrophosphatase